MSPRANRRWDADDPPYVRALGLVVITIAVVILWIWFRR